MKSELPVVVSTSFTVAANGEAGPTRLSDLINKYQAPMWVDEIRIASTAAPAGGAVQVFTKTHVRILFGRHQITHEFVPGTVLAPLWPGSGQIVMKLHKPLYVTPQDLPVPTVRSTVSQTIVMTLVGRLTQALPANSRIWVPYVTSFSGTEVAVGQTSSQESKRTDLANPFKMPFTVRFLLGYRTTEDLASRLSGGTANNSPSITVRLSNHLGRPVVRDPTPFYDVFNLRDQSWAASTILEPGGYFLANVDVNATSAVEAQNFQIGMFGYREEVIQ